ncbi:MAG: TlpA disulfide reductase family protein [Bacteroidota bacterium]
MKYIPILLLLCCGCFFSKNTKRPSKQLRAIDDIRLNRQDLGHWLDQPLPPFAAISITGDSIYSDSLKGNRIIINLFFSKCAPCILEIKHLNEMRKHYENQNVIFLAMTYEDAITAANFAQKYDFSYSIIPDYLDYYKPFIRSYPQNIFIDSQGIIRAIKGTVPLNVDPSAPILDAPFTLEDMVENMDPSQFYKIIDAME